MSQFQITVDWQRKNPDFKYETFDRIYTITFSGGNHIQASNPPEYFGNPQLPNPEELLISSLASCYMLTFLAVACKQGFIVDSYQESATGNTGKSEQGKNCVTEINLNPQITFGGNKQPDNETLNKMRDKAHANCFISNSVTARVNINIQLVNNQRENLMNEKHLEDEMSGD